MSTAPFNARQNDLLVAFAATILTLPAIFYIAARYSWLDSDGLDRVHIRTREGIEFDLEGSLLPEPLGVQLKKEEYDVDPVQTLLIKRISAIQKDDLKSFLELSNPEESYLFAKSWDNSNQKAYRQLISRSAGSLSYFGFLKYGKIRLAITCLQGKETKAEIIPFVEKEDGLRLSYLSPYVPTLGAVANAFESGHIYLVQDDKLVPIAKCVSTGIWNPKPD